MIQSSVWVSIFGLKWPFSSLTCGNYTVLAVEKIRIFCFNLNRRFSNLAGKLCESSVRHWSDRQKWVQWGYWTYQKYICTSQEGLELQWETATIPSSKAREEVCSLDWIAGEQKPPCVFMANQQVFCASKSTSSPADSCRRKGLNRCAPTFRRILPQKSSFLGTKFRCTFTLDLSSRFRPLS